MGERLPQGNPEMQGLAARKLWKELLEEKQRTDEARRASKALNFYASLTQSADLIMEGKTSPVLLIGIAATALTPYILDRIGWTTPSIIASDVFAAFGFAALAERELRVVPGSKKVVDKWVNNWILNTRKSKIDGKDVARVLLNLPKTSIKGPEEIGRWFTNNHNPEEKQDPYISVAKSVRGIIVVEEKYGNLNKKQKRRKEIGEAVRLMLEGQIIMQKEIRTKRYIAKEGAKMARNAAIGAVGGVLLSTLVSNLIGSQWGGPLGLVDDFAVFSIILKNKIVRAISKIKPILQDSRPSIGWKKVGEKQQKIESSLRSSQ